MGNVLSQVRQIRVQGTTACLDRGPCGVASSYGILPRTLGVPVAYGDDGRYAGTIGAVRGRLFGESDMRKECIQSERETASYDF